MGNEIYKKQNNDEFPPEVKARIDPFIQNIFSHTRPTNQIIEIGTGNGYIADALDEACRPVVRTDYYPTSDEVLFLDVNNIEPPTFLYDGIVLAHVLEHFSNPVQILLNLRVFGSQGTKIFIAVPNAEYPNDGYQPYSEDIGHKSFFEYNYMYDCLERAGYDAIKVLEMTHDSEHHELVVVAEIK